MGLRDRLMKNEPSTGSFSATVPRTPKPAAPARGPMAAPDAHHELKHELHQKLIEKLGPAGLYLLAVTVALV